eukprot:11074-Chlamydomonas_euryale.AAC.2
MQRPRSVIVGMQRPQSAIVEGMPAPAGLLAVQQTETEMGQLLVGLLLEVELHFERKRGRLGGRWDEKRLQVAVGGALACASSPTRRAACACACTSLPCIISTSAGTAPSCAKQQQRWRARAWDGQAGVGTGRCETRCNGQPAFIALF